MNAEYTIQHVVLINIIVIAYEAAQNHDGIRAPKMTKMTELCHPLGQLDLIPSGVP